MMYRLIYRALPPSFQAQSSLNYLHLEGARILMFEGAMVKLYFGPLPLLAFAR